MKQGQATASWSGNQHAEGIALIIILVVAAILRFYHYAGFSYSNDELSAISRLRFDSFSELVKNGFFVDGHPGGIQVFLWYWSGWFGFSEASLRLPFVIFGVLTVWMSYLVSSKMFGKVAGLFTAATLTFLEFPLLYSQIARPYGSGLFFSLLMVYFWLRIVIRSRQLVRADLRFYLELALYVLATSLCMYNHYFSFLLALIVGITGLFKIRKPLLYAYIIGGFVAVILFLPHLSITLNHLSYKGVGLWLGKPYPGWILEHLNFILNDSSYTIILITTVSILVSWKGKMLKTEKGMLSIALLWFLLPLIIGYVYSITISPVLQHPVLIFSFPFVIMLLFMGAGNVFGKMQMLFLAVYLLLGVAGTVFIKDYYKSQHFGEFKGVADATMKWEKEFGAGQIEKIVIANSPAYLDFYFEQLNYPCRYSLYKLTDEEDYQTLDSLMTFTDKPYFLYAWTKPPPEGVEDLIRTSFPFIVKSIQYGNFSKITLFSRKEGGFFEPGLRMRLLASDSTMVYPGKPGGAEDQDSAASAFRFNQEIEYSRSIERNIESYSDWEIVKLISSVEVELADSLSQAMLVISVEDQHGKALHWHSIHFDKTALTAHKWGRVYKTLDLEGYQLEGGKVKVYVWNQGKKNLKVRNLKLSILGYENHPPFSYSKEIWGDIND